jgi:hypothetical protein
LVFGLGAAAMAQQVGRAAVVITNASVYWLRDSQTPIATLAAGTHIQIVREVGDWYRVVYQNPSFGDEAGYVKTENIRLESDDSSQKPGANDTRPFTQRGFVEGQVVGFPQAAPNDATQVIGNLLFREEVFLKPTSWIQFAAGGDLRANSHDEVEDAWRLDFSDRGVRRPRVAVRRLTATITRGGFTLDAGKQFIRWGRADILNPTDRFAPRDYLNVIDSDVLPVLGLRPSMQLGKETFEAVWVPRLTPSRIPLFDQRWTVLPPEAAGVAIADGGSRFPEGSEWGVRWHHADERVESSVTYFDGFNHLPNIDVQVAPAALTATLTRLYPALRTYGGDLAIPTKWFTIKGEGAYFSSPSSNNAEYVLYVVELERQTGEWLLDGGYAGEAVTRSSDVIAFDAERGMARSFVGHASYTVDPRRTVTIEGLVRQDLKGFYVKGEYSQTYGQHWRLTADGVGIAGDESDFIGQYHRNSYGSIALRFSF